MPGDREARASQLLGLRSGAGGLYLLSPCAREPALCNREATAGRSPSSTPWTALLSAARDPARPKRSERNRLLESTVEGRPGGSLVKNPPANSGDARLIPDAERPHTPRGSEARANR